MTDNELDNLFKNAFNNHEAPIPADMWQRIQPEDTKKRPVVLWWRWYAAAAVFLIASMATWWYISTTESNNNKSISYNTGNAKETTAQTTQNADSAGVKNNQNATLQLNNSTDKQQTNTNKFTTPIESQLASSQPGGEKAGYHRNQNVNPVRSLSQKDATHTTDLNASALNQKDDIKPDNSDYNHLGQSQTTNTTNGVIQAQTSPNSATGGESDIKQSNNNTIQGSIKGNSNNTDTPVAANTKKDNKKEKHSWSLEVYGTTAYADEHRYDIIKENTLGMAAPIPQQQPKPSLWNYGAGVRLGIPVSKKLTFKTGVQFAQTSQKADYQQQNVVDMISVRGGDTSFYRQIMYESEKQKSTYNSLNIPVLISYQTGNKVQVGATAGIIVNAYSWYTGNVPNGTYTTTFNAKDTYKHNTGAALYASISVSKKVGTVDVFAEPHIQYSLSNITKPGVSFKQKINTYGLSVGVRTRLHK